MTYKKRHTDITNDESMYQQYRRILIGSGLFKEENFPSLQALKDGVEELRLQSSSATGPCYQIGDVGPAGGIIFAIPYQWYNWSPFYFEAAPTDSAEGLMPFFESRFSFEPPQFDFTQVLRGNSAQQIVEIFKGTEYGNVDVDILAPPFVQPPLQNNLLSIALAVPTIGMGDGEYLTDFVNNTYPLRVFSSPNLFFNRNTLVPTHNWAFDVAQRYVGPYGDKDYYLPNFIEALVMMLTIGPTASPMFGNPNNNMGDFLTSRDSPTNKYYWTSTPKPEFPNDPTGTHNEMAYVMDSMLFTGHSQQALFTTAGMPAFSDRVAPHSVRAIRKFEKCPGVEFPGIDYNFRISESTRNASSIRFIEYWRYQGIVYETYADVQIGSRHVQNSGPQGQGVLGWTKVLEIQFDKYDVLGQILPQTTYLVPGDTIEITIHNKYEEYVGTYIYEFMNYSRGVGNCTYSPCGRNIVYVRLISSDAGVYKITKNEHDYVKLSIKSTARNDGIDYNYGPNGIIRQYTYGNTKQLEEYLKFDSNNLTSSYYLNNPSLLNNPLNARWIDDTGAINTNRTEIFYTCRGHCNRVIIGAGGSGNTISIADCNKLFTHIYPTAPPLQEPRSNVLFWVAIFRTGADAYPTRQECRNRSRCEPVVVVPPPPPPNPDLPELNEINVPKQIGTLESFNIDFEEQYDFESISDCPRNIFTSHLPQDLISQYQNDNIIESAIDRNEKINKLFEDVNDISYIKRNCCNNNESLKILARYDENGDYVYNKQDEDENEIENEL